MGLFDELAGAAKGAMLQTAEGGAQSVLQNVLQGSSLGGLSGLVGQLQGAGLGNLVSSWQNGQGLPISMDQLKGALDPAHIQQIASALNMPADSALAHLAEHLPMLVGGQPQS